MSDPAWPARIGPYHIVERLGEGGMGVVYLARQEQPVRREVALKVLSHERASDAASVAQFHEEGRLAARGVCAKADDADACVRTRGRDGLKCALHGRHVLERAAARRGNVQDDAFVLGQTQLGACGWA